MKHIIAVMLLPIVFILLISCGGGGGGDDTPPSTPCESFDWEVPDIGFYWTISKNGGSFLYETNRMTTFVDIHVNAGDQVTVAAKRGKKILITNVSHMVKAGTFEAWVERYCKPYWNSIIGFYPYDEPFLNDVPFSEQAQVLTTLNNLYPDKEIWVTFAYNEVEDGIKVHPLYDVIGVTPHYDKFTAWEMKGFYDLIKLKPHQQFFVCADGFVWGLNEVPTWKQEWKADQMRDYYELAKCLQARALWIFIWMTFDDGRTAGTGVEDMPILEDEIFEIAIEIKNQ